IYGYLERKGRYIFTVEDWTNANVNGEPLDTFFQREMEYEQKLGIENDDLFVEGGKTYSSEEVKQTVIEAGGRITKTYSREMSHPAKQRFGYDLEISVINSKIKKLNRELKEEVEESLRYHKTLRVGKILKLGKELEEFGEKKKLFEEFKSIYTDKKLVVGTQHVFHTEKN
ncbi:MAG: hypothetical protein AABY26_04565, partial [Nanoarchaeota archaeon]